MCETSDLVKKSFAKLGHSTDWRQHWTEIWQFYFGHDRYDEAENRKSLPRKFLQTKTVNFDRRSPSEWRSTECLVITWHVLSTPLFSCHLLTTFTWLLILLTTYNTIRYLPFVTCYFSCYLPLATCFLSLIVGLKRLLQNHNSSLCLLINRSLDVAWWVWRK